MIEINIQPFGKVEDDILHYLTKKLELAGFKVHLLSPLSIPSRAWSMRREQYNASQFLNKLRFHPALTLGITDVDLFIPHLNFVFGVASMERKIALISIFRLRWGAEERKFKSRVIKEALHELGHVLGLRHCSNPNCVMYFSNCLEDTDRKSAKFCPSCKEKIMPV